MMSRCVKQFIPPWSQNSHDINASSLGVNLDVHLPAPHMALDVIHARPPSSCLHAIKRAKSPLHAAMNQAVIRLI